MSLTDELRRKTAAGTTEYAIDAVDYWSDAQLQAVVDVSVRRVHLTRVVLLPAAPASPSSSAGTLASVGGILDPEEPGELFDSAGASIEGFTLAGDGTIELSEPIAYGRTVYWTGFAYDLNAAAADVLDSWSAAVKLHFDVTPDGQGMSRSQKFKALRELADDYRRRTLPQSIDLGASL